MLKEHQLHNYQREAIQFIKDKQKCALFLDMGLGKTTSSLTAVAELINEFSASNVLVVAPLRVANTVWHKEIQNWEQLQHLRWSICTGTPAKRVKALESDSDIYIINRENIPWLVKYYGNKWPFDTVLIDESSSFKSSKSARFKALRKMHNNITNMVLLTGTPTSNGLMDLWSQICLIDNGDRLGKYMTNYKDRFFNSDYMGYNFTPKYGAEKEIHSLISDIVISMKAEDYLELPPVVYLKEIVQLDNKLKKQYKVLEKEFTVMLDNGEITALNAAVASGKMLQFANGAIYDEDKNVIPVHDLKIEALKELVEQNPQENILVAYNYKTDLQRLTEAFPDAVVMDKEGLAVDDWNEGKIKMLLAHPASAGHGLNLQKGGSMLVWFGINWSLELYQQFNTRLYRQGQTKPCRIIHLVTEGTIDEKVIDISLASKKLTQDELMSALKSKILDK